jgi:valyl-tRNA synthetase
MSHDLPKTYDPAAIEDRWAAYWVAERLFDQPATGSAKPFTMLLPPPNVTGRLHMGHMFEQAETDILVRWHRMQGDATLWIPGTDHASIATQMLLERQLATEGTTRQELGRERFLARAWQWREHYGSAILDQMKRLGASVNWSREYFTMDETLSVAVREAFVRLHEQGLIYRGNYIVNWDPVQQTAVSDLEVTHEDRAGKLYHVRYELADGPLPDGTASIVIATTRPETMLGDTAVAVNPDDARYIGLHGMLLRLPLSGVNGGADREIPIIADSWANPEFGTGAVKVTPAHDANDFAIGERHNLPKPLIMDAQARIELPGSPYHGLDRFAARERIVEDLRALGALVDVKDHPMSIGVSQRTGAVIEPRLSAQWFLRIQPLADKAIAAVEEGHIRFTPDQYRKTYEEWMRNIYDWCISRQLWWGHRIPAWHCGACAQVTVARETPQACAYCGSDALTQDADVLDTWFSAGLLPFTVFGWPARTPDLAQLYPTQLLITGFDILFFWVARMVMLGCWFMGQEPMPDGSPRTLADSVPFRRVYIHALVRDADRQKMSKTKGNVIDPIAIVKQYGTDAVRFTLAAMASPGTDIAFSEARTEGYRAFANKIWNAARFIFMNVDRAAEAGIVIDPNTLAQQPGPAELEARWITSRLNTTVAEVNAALDAYRFDEAANLVYRFFWGDFCDWYLEIVKLRLDFTHVAPTSPALNNSPAATGDGGHPERSEGFAVAVDSPANPRAALLTLLTTFEAALRLLSPFMPFLTEELWQAVYDGAPPAKSIALTRFPLPGQADADAEQTMALLQELISTVRAARKDLTVPERLPAETRIRTSARDFDLLAHSLILQKLAYVSVVSTHAIDPALPRKTTAAFDVQVLFERVIDPEVESARLTKEIDQLQKAVDNAERQLTNENFLSRAPSNVIEAMRTQQAQNSSQLQKKRADLDGLTLKR